MAAPTPFLPRSEELDLEGFRRNLRSWYAGPAAGVLVGGSTGEAVLLEAEERVQLVRAARAESKGGRLVVAGVLGESTRAAQVGVRQAAEAGADLVLVSPPAFYRGAMRERTLVAHYGAVAEASPVPVLVYQVPLRLGTIELPTSAVARISRLPNVAGIKDSRGELGKAAELIAACSDDFQVLVGSGGILLDSLRLGAVGGIVAVGAFAAEEAATVDAAFREGRMAEAEDAQARIRTLHETVVGGMGVPGVKAALELVGLVGGSPRRPLERLTGERRRELADLLVGAGLLDGEPDRRVATLGAASG